MQIIQIYIFIFIQCISVGKIVPYIIFSSYSFVRSHFYGTVPKYILWSWARPICHTLLFGKMEIIHISTCTLICYISKTIGSDAQPGAVQPWTTSIENMFISQIWLVILMEIYKKKKKDRGKSNSQSVSWCFFFFFNNHCILGHPQEVMIIVRLLIESFKKKFICVYLFWMHLILELDMEQWRWTFLVWTGLIHFTFKKHQICFSKPIWGLRKHRSINKF